MTSAKIYADVFKFLQLPAAYAPSRPSKPIIIAVFMARAYPLYFLIVVFSRRMTTTVDAMNTVALQ